MNVRLPEALRDLAPYYHDIPLGDGASTAPEQRRVAHAVDLFFPSLTAVCGGSLAGKRVLDLGCNCGGFSFAAARHGAREVVGIDPRAIHIRQAERLRDYLGLKNVRFEQARMEELSEAQLGTFDVCLAFGVFYHLSDPIQTIRRVSQLVRGVIAVDSHVHFSSDPQAEDIPSWWMLADTDMHDFDGLQASADDAERRRYLAFERGRPVDYSPLHGQFEPSPQTARDLEYVRQTNRDSTHLAAEEGGLATAELGSLVMVPNKKALVRLLRFSGFDDVLEVTPQRFSQEPYLRRYRVGLLAVRRAADGPFRRSVWAEAAAR